MPEHTSAAVVRIGDTPELTTGDTGNAIVPGEPLVDEGVVRTVEV